MNAAEVSEKVFVCKPVSFIFVMHRFLLRSISLVYLPFRLCSRAQRSDPAPAGCVDVVTVAVISLGGNLQIFMSKS